MALAPNELLDAIEEGQRLRGWIANGYAQVEYLLGDIITKSSVMPEYASIVGRLPHRVEKRIDKVKKILALEGFFSKYREELGWIIDAFECHHDTRNLLAHGFCTAYHTPDGDFGLEFRKWHRNGETDSEIRHTFRLINLEYEKTQLTHVSQRALTMSLAIHAELGLVGE